MEPEIQHRIRKNKTDNPILDHRNPGHTLPSATWSPKWRLTTKILNAVLVSPGYYKCSITSSCSTPSTYPFFPLLLLLLLLLLLWFYLLIHSQLIFGHYLLRLPTMPTWWLRVSIINVFLYLPSVCTFPAVTHHKSCTKSLLLLLLLLLLLTAI